MQVCVGQALEGVLREHQGAAGVVHLALQESAAGPVCSWAQELHAVAEPSVPCSPSS